MKMKDREAKKKESLKNGAPQAPKQDEVKGEKNSFFKKFFIFRATATRKKDGDGDGQFGLPQKTR